MALNDKQKRFCEEYLIDLNGTQAAIRAGYSKRTANEQASQLLAKLNIQEFIQEKQKSISDRNDNLTQKVIDELVKVGFSNIQDFITSSNNVVDLSEVLPIKAAAVASVKKSVTVFGTEDNGGTKEVVEFKLWDKISALEKLGKHLGIFEKDNAQKKPELEFPALSDQQFVSLIQQVNEAAKSG